MLILPVWHHCTHEALGKLLARLNEFSIGQEDIALIFQDFHPTAAETGSLVKKLEGNQTEKQRAAILLYVFGPVNEVLNVIGSPDISIRSAGTKYIALNKAYNFIRKRYSPNTVFPDFVPVGFKNYDTLKQYVRPGAG